MHHTMVILGAAVVAVGLVLGALYGNVESLDEPRISGPDVPAAGHAADPETVLLEQGPILPENIVHADKLESAEIPRDMAKANNEFAIDFYKKAALEDGKNIFFSPTSILVAFSVVNEGARGETARQIEHVFGLEPDPAKRHNLTASMMAYLDRDDPHTTLAMANGLWLADWFEPHRAYIDVAHVTYQADVEMVDFLDDGVERINTWASENTGGKIPTLISERSVSENTLMVITNAIYFKGVWDNEFTRKYTAESEFHKNNTHAVKTDFMSTKAHFDYVHSDGIQVLGMPYKGDRLSMLVILPENMDGMDELEQSLSAEQIERWLMQLENKVVQVSFPKFEAKTEYDLITPLQDMGIKDIFTPSADLTGIAISGQESLYVSQAGQSAYVKVTEEGTESAAAFQTGVSIVSDEPVTDPFFIADHPFLFMIYDEESGAILFMGKIVDPTQA